MAGGKLQKPGVVGREVFVAVMAALLPIWMTPKFVREILHAP